MSQPYRNPFFLLLVIVGSLFVVTASAYGLMAFQTMPASAGNMAGNMAGEAKLGEIKPPVWDDHPLWRWLREHAVRMLLAEVAALAVLTVAAIGTDRWWERRA